MISLLYIGTSALLIYIFNIQRTEKYVAVMYYTATPRVVFFFEASVPFSKILSHLGYFVSNLRTCWCTFPGLNNVVVYQNWQMWGMIGQVDWAQQLRLTRSMFMFHFIFKMNAFFYQVDGLDTMLKLISHVIQLRNRTHTPIQIWSQFWLHRAPNDHVIPSKLSKAAPILLTL